MIELEASFTWSVPDALVNALHDFEKQSGIRVHADVLDATREQRQLTDFAIFHTGPDLSEVGTTWLSSLISMGALRDFSPWEVEAFEREGAFFAPAWQPGVERGMVHAIPWRTDTRVIFYRRDLLQQAGIDEKVAFVTTKDMQQTLQRLSTLPETIPCAIPTNRHPMTLHVLAPWVWQAGGRFMNDSGRQTRFCEPEAMAGIRQYFETFVPAVAPVPDGTSDAEAGRAFASGQVAVIITGHWLLDALQREPENAPQVVDNFGLALTPGAQYHGAMSLVIWQHSRHPKEAVKLARFLASRELQTTYLREAAYLPARQQALNSSPFTNDPHFRLIGESLQAGRGFRAAYMWSLVEDRLATAISELWQQVFADPTADLSALIQDRLSPLAARLNGTLRR